MPTKESILKALYAQVGEINNELESVEKLMKLFERRKQLAPQHLMEREDTLSDIALFILQAISKIETRTKE